MSQEKKPKLGAIRNKIWPIYSEEIKVFLPMIIIMFWILFNYTLVRNVKDSLIVTAQHAGGSVLPFLKIMWVTPLSVVFVLLYAKLSNILSPKKLYYSSLLPFVIFFGIFGVFLYPYSSVFHASPDTVLAWKEWFSQSTFLAGFRDFVPTIGYWSFSMFYVMAELWGNVCITVNFWQIANHIVSTEQAKRFYPMFGFWANLGLICSGLLTTHSEKLFKPEILPSGVKDFSQQILLYTFFFVLGGVMIAACYWWMSHKGLTEPKSAVGPKKEKKPKMSMGESMRFLLKSPYLLLIGATVIFYGVTINIVEVVMKEKIGVLFTDPVTGYRDASAYSAYIGQMFMWTGIATMFLILVSKNLLRTMGWLFSASATPVVILVTGLGFFMFTLAGDSMAGFCALFGTTPLMVAVLLGTVQNILSKGVKYALFDPTKEMAYIPLDQESKVKGKAAIDVIAGRAGKSGGSIIQVILPFFFKSKNAIVASLAGILVVLCFLWVWATGKLSVLYAEKLKEKELEDKIK